MPSLTIQLPDDLGTPPADVAQTLADVRMLLGEIRDRLDTDNRLAVNGSEAAKLCGCCERTLISNGAPHVMLGSRRIYRVEALRQWLAEREQAGANV